jgi:DNA-binding NtrC family response regulator
MAEKPKIFVVEDDLMILEKILTELPAFGFEVFGESEFQKALVNLTKQEYSCVLMDLSIKGGSGVELVSVIRKAGSPNVRTPIIVSSGYLAPEIVMKLVGKVQFFLAKPTTVDIMAEKIVLAIKGETDSKGTNRQGRGDPVDGNIVGKFVHDIANSVASLEIVAAGIRKMSENKNCEPGELKYVTNLEITVKKLHGILMEFRKKT